MIFYLFQAAKFRIEFEDLDPFCIDVILERNPPLSFHLQIGLDHLPARNGNHRQTRNNRRRLNESLERLHAFLGPSPRVETRDSETTPPIPSFHTEKSSTWQSIWGSNNVCMFLLIIHF